MCTEEEIGARFVFVPGGPCVVGGDEEAFNAWPRKEITVEDYFVAKHPVTMGEYLENGRGWNRRGCVRHDE